MPLQIVIPPGTFLSPEPGAAVVAGNTEVSQAVCNALIGALGAMACSQATMNNFLFGDATTPVLRDDLRRRRRRPGFPGASAIQTHMTNTRMTDPEVLELRYPVRLEEFSIRRGSGGAGEWPAATAPSAASASSNRCTAVIVASRRSEGPFGMAGGAPGLPGEQWVDHPDGTRTVLTGTDSADMAAGDVFVIATPGGGGWGAPSAG